jgi:branched-chain amino acid transport system substrate-binding protein
MGLRDIKWGAGALAVLATTSLTACGSTADTEGSPDKPLTVYSSFPLQGAQRTQSLAVVNGIKLALEQAGGRAGEHKITYKPLDDSTAQAASWTPEATSANARKAAQDPATAAYIGESNSGATAVSLPILNQGDIPQVSYSNTAVGLTTSDPGSSPGEPTKYYPTGKRTYLRIVPRDTVQAAALVQIMKKDGCTKVALTNDKEVYGGGLAKNIELAAKAGGIDLLFNAAIDKLAANYRSLAQRAKAGGADCFLFSGITPNNAVQLFKDFATALPGAKLYGPDGIAETGFIDADDGGLPAAIAGRVTVTSAALAPSEYPPSAREFFTAYTAKFHVRQPDPYALYGYEAMRLVLDAIERSGDGTRARIFEELFATRDRQSVLGTYSINKDGDTTLTDYGAYRIENGTLVFDQTIKAGAAGS